MKIRIKRANTDKPYPRLLSGRFYAKEQQLVWDYIDELRQAALWRKE